MKVIIDARMVDKKLHGIARYTYELINHMCKDENIQLSILVNDIDKSKHIFGRENKINYIKIKSKFLSIKEQVELPLILNKYKNDTIFHSPSFVSSPFIRCKMVMTIHDINHLRFPQYYTPFHKYYYKFIVKTAALKCEKILTVSEFSKNEILGWLDCKEDKIVVTYNGVDNKFKVIDDKNKLNRVKEKYNLPDKFILYIGNLKPHKNVETLVEAMANVNQDTQLVINGDSNVKLEKLISEHKIKNRVKFIGYIDDDDLPMIYNCANIFVLPSLYEGFGLPALEAMACGCKTLVSNVTSLPEVVGIKELLFDPMNVDELSKKINKYIANTNDEIKCKVIKQASKFIWNDCFLRTKEVYLEMSNTRF